MLIARSPHMTFNIVSRWIPASLAIWFFGLSSVSMARVMTRERLTFVSKTPAPTHMLCTWRREPLPVTKLRARNRRPQKLLMGGSHSFLAAPTGSTAVILTLHKLSILLSSSNALSPNREFVATQSNWIEAGDPPAKGAKRPLPSTNGDRSADTFQTLTTQQC